jgi:hypothetical protein
MGARWGSFALGVWLVFAPLLLGYPSAAAVLHDVAIGLLVAVGALAALEWPLARFAQLVPAAWLIGVRGVGGETRTIAANHLAAGVLLAALAVVPSGRLVRRVAAAAGRAA